MKKKLVTGALLCAFGAVAVTGGTLAYFTDKEAKTNTFTVGNVDIVLTEDAWVNGGEAEAQDVYPGEAIAKDPTVHNVGANPCFVRVQVTGLDQFGNKGAITLRHGEWVEGYDSENWTYLNGYYYYNEVLATEATAGDEWNKELEDVTAPLFNQIVMPVGLEGSEKTTDIVVTAEAIQAQGARSSWSDVKAMTPADIEAWFNTGYKEIKDTPVDDQVELNQGEEA